MQYGNKNEIETKGKIFRNRNIITNITTKRVMNEMPELQSQRRLIIMHRQKRRRPLEMS